MGLKLGVWISLLLAGRSGSRDLTLGCTIWNIYRKELLSVRCVWWGGLNRGWFHSRLVSGGGWGSELLLEQVQLHGSFRNKFIILLPCGLLADNNAFSKMCVFKSLTCYCHECTKSKTTRIMITTVRHVTSSSRLRKYQAAWFLLNRVYN
jgi:hypothetical protein